MEEAQKQIKDLEKNKPDVVFNLVELFKDQPSISNIGREMNQSGFNNFFFLLSKNSKMVSTTRETLINIGIK